MFNQNFGDMNGGNQSFDPSHFGMPQPPQKVDQTASIIKNENGMYTIRNPAFQNAFMRLNKEPNSNNMNMNSGMGMQHMGGNDHDGMMGGSSFNQNSSSMFMPQSNPPPPKEDPYLFKSTDHSNSFGSSLWDQGKNKCYDDLSFLETLQPGQHLNSEVIFFLLLL